MANDYLKLDLLLDENKLQEGALAVLKHVRPDWDRANVNCKVFTDGISNKLIGAYLGDDKRNMVLVRIFGRKTELIINRELELKAFQVLYEAGLGPKLHATFKNGISYGYMPGSILSTESVRSDELYPIIAKEMARLHTLKPKDGFKNEPALFVTLRNWLKVLPEQFEDEKKNERYVKEGPSHERLEEEMKQLEEVLLPLKSPVVFAHNDLLLANIIHDKQENKVYFIDYEYANYNFQAFEIGNHFDEYCGVDEVDYNLYPEKEHQLKWIREYLKAWNELNKIAEPITDLQVEKLYVLANKFSLAAHFFWGTWGLIQAHNSTIDFDFLDYGIARFNEYFKNKEKFFALKLPE
ncbi:ethanolamine kinase 1-like [Apostichopus japonicus]|uniref:ethanolamine kinase 1-like n=1 Tax=Stichopus japonicus TaxID=307972 RepID=UPI003AB613D5